jgi:tRNA(fMet)-specific endonuclease VapC
MPILDSDVLIQYMRGNPNAIHFIDDLIQNDSTLSTTIFNVGELFKGIYESKNPAKTEREINDLLESCEIFLPNMNSAKIWAQITTELKMNYGKQFLKENGDMDQLIASIALEKKEALITHNIHHYDKIRGLTILNWDNDQN